MVWYNKMMRKKKFGLKKCPRCGYKNTSGHRCEECGLLFSRVENGSNKLAKQLLLARKRDEVVFAPVFRLRLTRVLWKDVLAH